ncbi:unnamed protein product [Clonostachys rosea]|uniref:Extracellular metalloproteinase n=1 Tax=Bionectria ochroleuca TaxID=29856 RepID=A0ABY6U703_BIOOC|nr:unnamed protein product [Clonostachys rosea]
MKKQSFWLLAAGLAVADAHARRPRLNTGANLQRRGVNIDKYLLPDISTYTDAASLTEVGVSALGSGYVETATSLVKSVFPTLHFRLVNDHYVGTNGMAHVNFKQTVHGIDIDNADFHVNVGADGKVFSYGHSFFTGSLPREPPMHKRDTDDPVEALKGAVAILGLPVQITPDTTVVPNLAESAVYSIIGTSGAERDPEARLVYLQQGNEVKLSWRVETDVVENWLLTYVNADPMNEILGVVDYVSDLASYQVYRWGVNDPDEGSRTTVVDPWLLSASPFTWISDGTNNYTTTRGNNGIAQVNPSGGSSYLDNYRPDSPDLKFEYPYSPGQTNPVEYRNASITQLFYTANMFHDLLYTLGFTEAAGNFQVNNNGQGGQGDDAVILDAQDGSGFNNAYFATPPDGSPGRMTMLMYTWSPPERDSTFEAGVVIHEYAHGLSNRLTGGPANSKCLGTEESGGMGEGWSDFFATAIRIKPNDTRETDYPISAWVNDWHLGIRAYPYSTSMTTNPHVYSEIDKMGGEPHSIGEIWASVLYEILWNLIDKYGKNDGYFPDFDSKGVPTDGKFLTMKLVLDAMALQPCYPAFNQARKAIIDADQALTGGANYCELWAGFAKRGMGPDATNSTYKPRLDDFNLPVACLN